MSRGIDIKEINMVINYDVPHDAADYVHRVGRTARAETKGEAVTLVNQKDMYKFKKIEELIESDLPKLMAPEEFGESPKWSTAKPKFSGGRGKGNFKKKGGGYKGKKTNNQGKPKT
jgi:superfamily II DNA/RNA helicase